MAYIRTLGGVDRLHLFFHCCAPTCLGVALASALCSECSPVAMQSRQILKLFQR